MQFNLVAGILISIILFSYGVISLPAIKDVISDARTSLDCSNTAITTYTKLTCIGIDSYLLVFFALTLAGAAYFLKSKDPEKIGG